MPSGSSRVSGDSGEAIAKAWAEIQERFEEIVRSITLAELAVRENQEMYYI